PDHHFQNCLSVLGEYHFNLLSISKHSLVHDNLLAPTPSACPSPHLRCPVRKLRSSSSSNKVSFTLPRANTKVAQIIAQSRLFKSATLTYDHSIQAFVFPIIVMDEKLRKTLASSDFEDWRRKLWKEISKEAIGEGWVADTDITNDYVIDHRAHKWIQLWETLVEIRYLFRPPVSRCVHAKFRSCPKAERQVSVRYLSFHTSPHPSIEDKHLFEKRRAELLEWRKQGGTPPKVAPPKKKPPKAH
ncbi:hypothetical protein BT63DRAFT_291084, partial [Microthyrium microscopicum]